MAKPFRMRFVSPWVWFMLLIFGVFLWIAVSLVLGYGGPGGNRVFGLALGVFMLGLAVFDLSGRIVVVDQDGFHALLRRKIRWRDAQFAELAEIVPGFIPNVTIRVVLKAKDPETRQYEEYVIQGLAGFRSGKRQERMVSMFNDLIAKADPDWVINPWLHRSDRPDNR